MNESRILKHQIMLQKSLMFGSTHNYLMHSIITSPPSLPAEKHSTSTDVIQHLYGEPQLERVRGECAV